MFAEVAFSVAGVRDAICRSDRRIVICIESFYLCEVEASRFVEFRTYAAAVFA